MLRLKQRNESSGSGSSTVDGHDTNIAANLSNLSTTPTFSNLARASAPVQRAPTAADAAGTADDVQTPHESSPNDDNAAQLESFSGPFYRQPVPLSTFSFSRMPIIPPSRMQPIANAAEIASCVPMADGKAASLTQPAHASYNSQPFLPRVIQTDNHSAHEHVGNKSWTNFMFGRGSSLTGTVTDNTTATDVGMASSRFDANGTSDQLSWGSRTFMEKRGPRGGRGMSRPPMSPNPSNTLQQTRNSSRIMGRGGGRPAAPHPNAVEEYDGSVDTSVAGETSSVHYEVPEVPLSTGLVSLSIHEALTFDGVELALHPDVFVSVPSTTKLDAGIHDDGTKSPGTSEQMQTKQHNRIRPGDLVEIRVWTLRPGAKVDSNTKTSSSNTSSALKANSTITGGSNYHSRNPSLITLSSILSPGGVQGVHASRGSGMYLGNTPLLNTPLSLTSPGDNVSNDTTSIPPPLPSIIGGNGPSPTARSGASFQYTEIEDRGSSNNLSDLQGENIIDNFRQNEQVLKNTPSTSNLSSMASTLLTGVTIPDSLVPSVPLLSQNNMPSFSTVETDSLQGHSRDSSLITNSSAMHSRDNSLMSPSPSWLIGGGGGGTGGSPSAKDESTVTFPNSVFRGDTSSSTSKVPPPSHPLAGISQHYHPPFSKNLISSAPLSVTPPSLAFTNSSRKNAPHSSSTSVQRPPLAPSHEVYASTSGELGVNSISKTLSMDLISEVESPERSQDVLHKRHSSVPASEFLSTNIDGATKPSKLLNLSTASNIVPPSTLPKLSETDDANNVPSHVDEEDNTIDRIHKTHFVRVSFVMPITERSLSCIKSGARTQVSLLRRVADLYKINAFCPVTVTRVMKKDEAYVRQSNAADFITVTMKDQFVSRRDMYSFQKSFLNDWVYEGKRLVFDGIRTNAKVIRHGNHAIKSGIITEDTKITFRSRSARIIWLVQMSSEMWDFASPYDTSINHKTHEPTCHIYFDKFVAFCHRLFAKWKKLDLTHNLTVIYFSRTYLYNCVQESTRKEILLPSFSQTNVSPVHVDADGRFYEDHYKIVIENETRADWESLIPIMKREFLNYPKGVKWDLSPGNERIPSTASQGNVLESINITLNLLHLHYVDRDLHRTGNSLVVITPGNGVFEIDKNLASITKQRMMDNGIGSDMLSLSLPPLHIAPFFLYKEKGTSSAEELQGFDDWKVFFEIPHWMNLSFVCYDDEEEPMLYNQNGPSDSNTAKKEFDTISHTWHSSNGLLIKAIIKPLPLSKSLPDGGHNLAGKSQYKHMISDRDFDDILQACRPRNRGERGSGLPVPLASLINKMATTAVCFPCNGIAPSQQQVIGNFSRQRILLDDQLSPQQMINHRLRGRYLEWGAVNFENYNAQWMNDVPKDDSGSQSSPSSFVSSGSCISSLQPGGLVLLQSSMSLDDGSSHNTSERREDNHVKDFGHDDSMSSCFLTDVAVLKKIMSNYDKNAFSKPLKHQPERLTDHGFPAKPSCPSPLLDRSGIEAALEHYDNPREDRNKSVKELPSAVRAAGTRENSFKVLEEACTRSMALSPHGSGLTPFSFDRRMEGLRPSVMRLVAPEALSGSLNPLGSRRKSFSVFHDSFRPVGESGRSTHLKTPKHHHPKIPPVQQTLSKNQPNRGERVQPHQHVTHRRRRKHWVLNPFRQDDEDEVLAKKTHNRRRWSHVFPLGEEEFKRHAGPNWKSLCQPAILPITIDFHPSTKELQDKERFRIKQYSVTLPPMNETNYKSHTELLDELVAQRIIQDFQIVPRAIISSRRDVSDNILEHTLSMGHKIQQLSYNPSNDSVDVIQYYANFAENENPQIYRYSLWSTLMQDYVSVAQTFTKYTSPYKWNEVDMLISGDAITHILEGMRYPRISFVIIPDHFSNPNEEKEYVSKFQRLIDYFIKLHPKDPENKTDIEIYTTNDSNPRSSLDDKRFVVDLRKRCDEKYSWMEMVHDSNCDTRRTFRITIQWLVAVSAKIEQQAQLLQRRCTQYGLKLVSVPHYSALRSCFLNPFVVPLTIPIRNKNIVDVVECALTKKFGFVYDGCHMSDPNELDNLDGFDFLINKWSIKKRKKFVPANQYLHRSGTLFGRILRDSKGCAIFISYLNMRHVGSDVKLRSVARNIFRDVEYFIANNNES